MHAPLGQGSEEPWLSHRGQDCFRRCLHHPGFDSAEGFTFAFGERCSPLFQVVGQPSPAFTPRDGPTCQLIGAGRPRFNRGLTGSVVKYLGATCRRRSLGLRVDGEPIRTRAESREPPGHRHSGGLDSPEAVSPPAIQVDAGLVGLGPILEGVGRPDSDRTGGATPQRPCPRHRRRRWR